MLFHEYHLNHYPFSLALHTANIYLNRQSWQTIGIDVCGNVGASRNLEGIGGQNFLFPEDNGALLQVLYHRCWFSIINTLD